MTTVDMLAVRVALTLAIVVGALLGLAAPTVLRHLPEPPPDPDPAAEVKIAYAALATRRFAAVLAVVSLAATALPALTLPVAQLPAWLVLATLGVLLAAIDARSTWLPLPLTRVAWATMAAAVGVGGLLAGLPQALRGMVGFVLAGALFGGIWLLTRGGFGFGDVRYAALVGAAAATPSWTLLAWSLVLGSLVGAVVGLARLTAGRRGSFPYAPSILAGSYLALALAWLTT